MNSVGGSSQGGSGQPESRNIQSSTSPRPLRKNSRKGGCGSGQHATGKHPLYRGIRSRSGKWVSEIREPGKTTRIWLGTYPSPEMAAAAYDVATLALRGEEALLNFRDLVGSYPVPESVSPVDIRTAASRAAALIAEPDANENLNSAHVAPTSGYDYIDEEELFDYPNLLVDMAKGMLMSPPRMGLPPTDNDSRENSEVESLWSYI